MFRSEHLRTQKVRAVRSGTSHAVAPAVSEYCSRAFGKVSSMPTFEGCLCQPQRMVESLCYAERLSFLVKWVGDNPCVMRLICNAELVPVGSLVRMPACWQWRPATWACHFLFQKKEMETILAPMTCLFHSNHPNCWHAACMKNELIRFVELSTITRIKPAFFWCFCTSYGFRLDHPILFSPNSC